MKSQINRSLSVNIPLVGNPSWREGSHAMNYEKVRASLKLLPMACKAKAIRFSSSSVCAVRAEWVHG